MKKGLGKPIQTDSEVETESNDVWSDIPDQAVLSADDAVPTAPAPTKSVWDDIPDSTPKTQQVYKSVSSANPDEAAKVLSLSKQTGEAPVYVQKNLPAVEKAAAAPGSSFFQQLEEKYPGTTKFLSDPKNMAVSHDDLENVAGHEDLIKKAENYLGSLYDSAKYGAEGSAYGMILRQALPDDKLAPKDPDVVQRFATAAGGFAGDAPFMTLGSLLGGAAGATAGAVAGSPGAIPGMALGVAAGGVAGGGVGAFALPAALKTYLKQQIQDGKITSWSDIMKEASKQGFVGLLTSGAGLAAKAAFPGTALGAKTVLSTAAPLAAEVGTMTVAGSAVEGKAPTWQDFFDNTLQVGGMHLGTHALETAFQDKKAQDAKGFYTALGDTAEASKLRERMPEAYKELVHNLTVDGPVEHIYVPADAAESYFQSKGIDPSAAMEELGVSKSYEEAKTTGGDIQIPLSTWTDKIVGTEHYQGLADDVKFHPEDMTVREVNQRKADIQEQVKSLMDERKAREQAQSESDAQAKKQEETSRVFQVIQEQLKAAGLSRPETEFNPQIHEAFFNTMGKALGVAPEELAKRFPLDIARRESPEMAITPEERMAAQHQEGQSFDQSVYHGSPHIFDEFSLDKIGTGEGAQAFGHGLYFASDKEVAKHYRDALSKVVLKDASGKDVPEVRDRGKNTARAILKQAFAAGETGSAAFSTARNDIKAQLEKAKESAKDPTHYASKENVKTYTAALKHLAELEKSGTTAANQGRLYHVEIPEPHEFMDWDKPLSQQPEAIRRILSQLGDINEGNKVIKTPSGDYGIADKENGYWDTEAPTFKSKKEAQAWLKDPTGEQFYEYLVRQNDGDQAAASQALHDMGLPGLKYLDGTSRASGDGSHNYVLFNDALAEIKSYEQGAPKLAEATPRGRIRIGREGYAIDLFKNADRSTFLHETGHYFLDVMGHIASDESAPQQIKDDFKTILDWMGVKSREEIGTDEHEKFARGVEQYLMEGKAPSPALARAFNRFRAWLTKIYGHVKNLNVDMSDDVRGVLDRMLATQEEIERAQQSVGISNEISKGLSPELEAKVRDLQVQAREQAETALLKEQMKETTEKHKAFLKSEREKLTDAAEKEVDEIPVFKASDEAVATIGKDRKAGTIAEKFLSEKLKAEDAGKFEALAEVHGFGSGEEMAHAMILAEEGNLRQREISMRVEAGMTPHADLMNRDAIKTEAIKAIHNEKTTELLALEREALSQLVHKADVQSEAKRRDRAEAEAERAQEEAEAAKEKDEQKRAAIVEKIRQRFEARFQAEHDKIINQEVSRRQRIEARVEAQAAKDQAREILSEKPIKDATNAAKYVTAERNAAVKAAKALAAKDYEKASEFKRQQMLNHAIASEAMRNKTEAGKSIDYLSDFAKRKNDLKDMPYGFIRQIDQLLSKSSFTDPKPEDSKTLIAIAKDMAAKGEEPAEIANRTGFKQDGSGAWVPETLPDFIARVNENYYPLTLPDSTMSGATKAYEDLTLQELRELKASVKSIAEIGKKYDRFMGEFKTMDMKQASVELAKSIQEKYGTPFADETKAGSAYSSKFQEKIASLKTLGSFFSRWLDTMYTTCHKLDGLEEGPAKEYIFRPFERAADQKSARTAEAMKEVEKIFSDHYDPKELKDYKESRVKVGDRYFTKENILSMALNWGNEGNKSRLLTGLGLTEDQITKAFSDHLDKTDWDFVQKTWDHIDKYWPEISKLEMDVNGVEPKKIQASPFTNEHGSYQGGYYPIAYDPDRSADAFKNAEQRDALYKQFSTAKAATEQGFTESRVQNVNRPLRLSLDVLRAHHEDVIHDLEFRKATIDASRFLNQKEVKASLVAALGIKGYAGILEWVKAAASDGARQEPLNPWETAAQWFRLKSSIVNMGLKVAATPKIFLENVNNVTSELGMTDAARAIGSYLTGSDMHEKVIGKSDFMEQRAKHLDRDMADVMRKVQGERGPTQWVAQHAFFIHAYTDQAFSFPLWNFAYDKAIEEHGVESKAVAQADEAVRRTFMSSGGVIDQARIMRGGEYQKAALVAYGYSSMMWNRFSLQAFDAKSQWIQGNHMAAAATTAKAFVHTFMVPALVTALTGALVHNSQNGNSDEEKKKVVADFLSDATPLRMIPVARDVTRYGVNKIMGVHTSDLQLSPQEMAIQRLFTPLADVAMSVKNGQVNEKLPEHVANSLSFVAGVPKELNDVVFNLLDFTKGQGELTYRDALSRRTKH